MTLSVKFFYVYCAFCLFFGKGITQNTSLEESREVKKQNKHKLLSQSLKDFNFKHP